MFKMNFLSTQSQCTNEALSKFGFKLLSGQGSALGASCSRSVRDLNAFLNFRKKNKYFLRNAKKCSINAQSKLRPFERTYLSILRRK